MKNEELCLKLLVEKESNQIVFAESNEDFVDVVFSFMTIPIGRIIKLVGEQQSFGCMGNIYASVEKLDDKFLQNRECRDMLLHPRSAAEVYCRKLKVNLDETKDNEYYTCGNLHCSVSFYYQNGHCHNWHELLYKLRLPSPNTVPQEGGVFMKSSTHFMVSSDLNISPLSTMTGLTLLRNLGEEDVHGNRLEERNIKFGKEKVLELLKCSLVSRKPLTEVFLGACPIPINYSPWGNDPTSVDQSLQTRASKSTKMGAKICLKLIVDTGHNKVLYAEAERDFVDLLYSFLTFPLGYLYKRSLNWTFKGCMDNLYKSIQDIDGKLFESVKMKETLVVSKLVPGYGPDNQLISIEEATGPSCADLIQCFKASRHSMSSKPRKGEAKTAKGFIKGPSNFMVTDSLEVTHLSSISDALSLFKGMRVPLSFIDEKKVVMGEDEALRLFVASLVSENALTAAFLL